MADEAAIASALFAKVATLSIGSPALPIDFPEPVETFVPPASGKYLSARIFYNRPAWEGLSGGKISQGLLQINVVWPKNKGVLEPLRAARDVIAVFTKGLALTGNVRVSAQPWAASPISAPSEVVVPVTIPWTA